MLIYGKPGSIKRLELTYIDAKIVGYASEGSSLARRIREWERGWWGDVGNRGQLNP
jgi:hypothetical protein